ncbi:MAG: hypothetical protein OIF48_01655 [Silicimonas sp.]|nr:hypothetical protein [Silicimonas sp.]
MSSNTNRILSDLPSGDPALLNRLSWARRWSEPAVSRDYALAARKKALDGHGRRSRAEQGYALRTLGWHAFWRGDLTLAMEYCLQAEGFLPELKFIRERAGIYALLGRVHATRNRFDLAKLSIERGLWLINENVDEPVALADLYLAQANMQRLAGERARANATLNRALAVAEGENRTLIDLATADLLLEDGDGDKALDHARKAESAVDLTGNRVFAPFVRATLAACYLALGKHLDVHDQISQGQGLLTEGEDMLARCLLLRHRAALLIAKDDKAGASAVLAEAGEIARAETYKLHAKAIALSHADVLEALGDYKGALAQHKRAWRLQNETRVR